MRESGQTLPGDAFGNLAATIVPSLRKAWYLILSRAPLTLNKGYREQERPIKKHSCNRFREEVPHEKKSAGENIKN
jgi:hypothetical protein